MKQLHKRKKLTALSTEIWQWLAKLWTIYKGCPMVLNVLSVVSLSCTVWVVCSFVCHVFIFYHLKTRQIILRPLFLKRNSSFTFLFPVLGVMKWFAYNINAITSFFWFSFFSQHFFNSVIIDSHFCVVAKVLKTRKKVCCLWLSCCHFPTQINCAPFW